MGSQTLEIIRQGVWASLTGGWFYDPHQNVFCNAVHLYLWLFLLCAPFVTYLYFPTTFTTWSIYCITTTFTITILKIINMALHVLYDKAQAISDPNLKVVNKGFKEMGREDDCGIEMQVLRNDNMPSRTSVDQPINEVSEANSMISLNEQVTSTIDLKVDVHRKNSSESSDSISIYPPGVLKNISLVATYRPETNHQQQQNHYVQQKVQKHSNNNSNQQQHLQQQCQNEPDHITRRYSDNTHQLDKLQHEIPTQHSVPLFKDRILQQQQQQINSLHPQQQQQQQFRKHHHRNFSQGHEMYADIWRTPAPAPLSQQSLTSISQQQHQQQYHNINSNFNELNNKKKDEKKKKCKTRLERQNSLDTATQIRGNIIGFCMNKNQLQNYQLENTLFRQRSAHICCPTNSNNGNHEINCNGVEKLNAKAIKRLNKTTKLQRHKSTESHEENQRSNNRNILYLDERPDNISGYQMTKNDDVDDINHLHHHHHHRTQNHFSSFDIDLSNNSYTKSDLDIKHNISKMEHNINKLHSLFQQSKSMRKDSNSTMSALQLPVASSSSSSEQQKTRRHSNTGCKPLNTGNGNNSSTSEIGVINGHQSNVRRIKSTALEISCQQPSVSNLSPHPNSVEAIAGQQIKNPQSALLPPPSKCLVRNQHLNLCSKFGNLSINSNDLIKSAGIMEPVYPEETETDDKCSISDSGAGNNILFISNKLNCDSDNDNNNDICDLVEDDDEIEKRRIEMKRCSMTESESELERPRTQSTDSETDNNGSRSPLLNKCRNENKSNGRTDDIKIQKHQNFSNTIKNGNNFLNKKGNSDNNINLKNNNNNNNNPKNDNEIHNVNGGDSGCPSSDCEQISASSKDMLLENELQGGNSNSNSNNKNSGSNINNSNKKQNSFEINEIDGTKQMERIPRGLDIAQEEADIENLRVKDAKSLGAIPKTIMRRSNEFTSLSSGPPVNRSQKPKSMSRTSSSASSRSFSAESFSNDIYKTYKDNYFFGGIGTHISSQSNGTIVTGGNLGLQNSSMALPASACTTFGAYPRRTFVDSNYRLHHKLRGSRHNHYNDCERIRKMEEISSNYNYDSDDLQKTCLENSTNATTTTTTAALSIQGLMNEQYSFENSLASGDQPQLISVTVGGSGLGGSSSVGGVQPNILNVGGESIYCDFPWHPCSMSIEKPIQPKRFYKYRLEFFGKRELKIAMDRLQLLALFDRDLNWFHVILAIILSSIVCFLGAIILQLGFYKDIFAFIFCIVIAGSQYSLLKSVQPDAASPVHGFNKTVAYSRPIYFCLCSGLLIFTNHLAKEFAAADSTGDKQKHNVQLFGIIFSTTEFLQYITNFMSIILLFFPVFFSLGLFPQINTFCMYFLEQIDMHFFGGNAACSLAASIFCVLKSITAVCILYGPAFGGLIELKGTQHFLFSFFCALLIPFAYHLSRSASDFSHIWAIIKSTLVNTYKDDDDDDEENSSNNNNSNNNNSERQETQQDDEKSTNVQHGSTTKEITTSPSSVDVRHKEFKIDDDDLQSQQSKTICSTESKLDIVSGGGGGGGVSGGVSGGGAGDGDKTDDMVNNINSGEDGVGENESTTATLSSGQPVENIVVTDQPDPLPKKLQSTVNCRLKNDLVVSTVLAVIVLSLHCSTIFTVLQPDINVVLYSIAGLMGFLLHYIIPQMRKHMPWLCFARPILRQKEFGQFEVSDAAKIMWFEGAYVYLCFLERNVLYPLIFISAMTADSSIIVQKFGTHLGAGIVTVCSLKCVRNSYSDPANQYLILVFSVLLFKIDFNFASETFLINYFLISILFKKTCDFLLKLQFIVTYIAPWQITWGSAFHAFAQPFSVPHSAMLFLQAALSAILSTPLNPFLGSAIFLTSYVRPIKFWERDYNTRRIDHSNTRLSSQLERDLGADDNNLNSIFYEHLTRSLQHSLCGDLLLGRWGNVNQGDCFVLASDYLNCLVHIIELGNGLCTFQMRGLEFRGTYCQQREVEAISEGVEDNDACCCCNPGHIPRMLSANAMFSTRWLAWQVVAAQYVLEGYSISENLATATLQVFEFRKVLITYYIKSIIYYVIRNPKLEKWLASGPIQDALASTLDRQFVDLDIIFNYNLDEDFDFRVLGITRSSFCSIYLGWIQFCYKKRKDSNGGNGGNDGTSTTPESHVSAAKKEMNTAQKRMETSTAKLVTENTINNNINSNNNNSKYSNGQSTSLNPIPFANSPLGVPENINDQAQNNDDYNQETLQTTTNTNPLRRNKKKIYKRKLKFGEPDSPVEHQQPLNSFVSNANSPITKDSALVSLCLALGLLARRSLATATHSSLSGVEFFLHGLHALFKGDFRITSPRDEWVFADMELLHGVVAPAVKMALKLHQDHFSSPDEYLDPSVLYEAITTHSKDLVISHEADPIWRSAVLRGAPNLLALRHVMEDGSDEYRIIRLTKRFLSFRVIKLNRECVRGLWAGQQQELIYLRNRNPERGSIQNAKQALRNIINSSCDQPIGYPIYVSPLTTSYADTNEQLCRIIGGSITLESIKQMLMDSWRRIRQRCREGCSSGSGGIDCDIGANDAPVVYFSPITATNTTGTLSYGSQSLSGTGTRGSLASMNKPNSSTLLAGFLNRERDQEREIIREGRSNRKNNQAARNERDRRATLPITSSTMNNERRDIMTKESLASTSAGIQKLDYSSGNGIGRTTTNSGKTKTSCSSGNLGDINQKNIDSGGTSDGISNNDGLENFKAIEKSSSDEGNNCDSPIHDCGAVSVDETSSIENRDNEQNSPNQSSLIELNRKVIIVDGMEIYDCLDLGRRIDVVWPNEVMRANGGRSSWEDWSPQEGMVGYIRHFWQPNHSEQRFRSNVNRTLYLIEIGDRYVPVGESGIREYNQILNDPATQTQTTTTTTTNNLITASITTTTSTLTTTIKDSSPPPTKLFTSSNMKRSSIQLNGNNPGTSLSNLHKSLITRDYPSCSFTITTTAATTTTTTSTLTPPTTLTTTNELKKIPFTEPNDEFSTASSSTTTTTNTNTTIPNMITKLKQSKTNHYDNKGPKKLSVYDMNTEIFENLSNNTTESEDSNASDLSSPTVSENSNSSSIDNANIKDQNLMFKFVEKSKYD